MLCQEFSNLNISCCRYKYYSSCVTVPCAAVCHMWTVCSETVHDVSRVVRFKQFVLSILIFQSVC